jgi:hypothetical protein
MTKSYIAISALIFLLVAAVHVVRIALGWQVQVGPNDIPMSLSWVGFVVAAVLAVWGAIALRQ